MGDRALRRDDLSRPPGRSYAQSLIIPVRGSEPPIEVPLRRRKKQHDLDDFEVIDDLPQGAKAKIDRQKQYNFRRKKPFKWLMTKEIARYFDRETYLKVSLKEAIIFFGFVVILCLLSFSITSPVTFYYTKVMSRMFVQTSFMTPDNQKLTFQGINSLDHVWPYIEKVALNNFFWEFWYSRYDQAPIIDTDEEANILYENKLIGVPRFRQLRVRSGSCEILSEFKTRFVACYAGYSPSTEDTQPFGLQEAAWEFNKASKLGSHSYSTEVANYGGGGYVYDLNLTYSVTKATIEKLKENIWLDRATRVLFIDFTTYNANVNLFCIVKLIFEVPPTGGVLPSFQFHTLRLIRDTGTWDYVQISFEVIFIIYVIFYVVEEIYEMSYFRWQYVKRFWNWLDFILLCLCFTVMALQIFLIVNINLSLEGLVRMKETHPVFDELTSGQTMFNIALSVLIFLAWIKMLKYLSINQSMYQMQTTLTRASSDLICYSIIFFTIFCAFAEFGHLKFGTEVEDFRTFQDSVFALLRTVVGDFNYLDLERADSIVGPLYFLVFVYLTFFVFANMYLAIIINMYSEVRSEINSGGVQTHFSDLMSKYFNSFLKKIGCKKLAESRKRKAQEDFARSTYQDIRTLLSRCGFSDLEMDLFFAKYEITEDRLINPEEMRKILLTLEELPSQDREGSTTPEKHIVSNDQMTERVINLEQSVLNANTKIDIILNKLESMRQSRMARRKSSK